MTLFDILNKQLEGKRIRGDYVPLSIKDAVVVNVQLNTYEPIFEIVVRQPNGAIEIIDILEDWDIVAE